MANLTVGTLVAVLQLRAEQFVAANRQAQVGLQTTAAEARATAVATEQTDAAFAGLGATTGIINNRLKDTTGTFIAAGAGADKLTIANERLRIAQLQVIAAQERYDVVMASGTASTGELAAAEARLTAAQTRVAVAANQSAEAMARSGAAATAAAAQTEAAAARQSGAAARGLSTVAATVAKTGALLGGVALVFSAANIAQNGNEFTHALNTLAAASGGTAEQLEAARQQAIAMGKDLTIPKVTAADAALAMEDLVKAGVSLDRAMTASRPALLLAAAANVKVADSARVTGDLLDEWGFSADKATHVADVMAGAANSAGGGLMDLFGAMKYVGPSARQLGVGFDYTTAALVQLAKAGIQGSMAGTSLRNMLTRLSPAGAPAKAALTALGVSAFDATGKFKGLPVVFDQLHEAAERLSPQAFAANVSTAFGARALSAVQIFAHGGSEALQRFYDKVEAANVQEFADKMNRGVGAGFAQLGKEFSAIGLDIYNVVQGPLSTAVHWIGEELPKAVEVGKTIIGAFAHDASGVLAPAWTAVSAVFRGSAGVLKDVFGFLGQHAGTLKVVAEAAGAMWLAMKGYAVVTAAASAIAAFTTRTTTGLATSAGSVRAWGANWSSVLAGTGTSAEIAAAQIAATEAAKRAALAETIAATDVAAAASAEAYAVMVLASDNATATMIANAANTARAAQTQAEVSIAAAAETAAAVEVQAAAVVAAGEVAAVGWRSLLGPIGLVVAALSVVGLHFLGSGDKAKSASIGVDAFTDAIERDSGALGTNTRAAVANQLSKDGAFKAARQLGIGTDVLTTAVLKGGSAMKTLRDQLTTTAAPLDALQAGMRAVGANSGDVDKATAAFIAANPAIGKTAQAAQSLLGELNGVSGGLATAKTNAEDVAVATIGAAAAADKQAAATEDLTVQLGGLAGASDATNMKLAAQFTKALAAGTAQDALQKALSGTTTAAQGLSDALGALNGTLSSEQAQNSFLDAQAQLKQSLTDSGGSLDQMNDKGRAANETFLSGVTAAQQYAIAQTQTTGSVQAGITTYQQSIDALFATAAQSGATAGQMDVLRTAVDNVPQLKQILTQVLGDQAAKTALAGVKGAVDSIPSIKDIAVKYHLEGTALGVLGGINPGQTSTPVLAPTGGGGSSSGHVTGGHAQGGLINAPGTGSHDTAMSPVANREFVNKAASVNKFGAPFFEATNRGDMAGAFGMLAAKLGVTSGAKAPTVDNQPVIAALEQLVDAVYDTGGRTVNAIEQQSIADRLRGVSTLSGRPF